MSNTIGRSKDLNSSRKEALQGLLSSLGHTNDDSSSNAKLSAEQLHDLSEKLNEILRDDSGRGLTPGGQPSQLLNEDGDPIVDISEPVNEGSQENIVPSSVPEQDLVPFSLLPPDEREWRRRERDRILDLLEEEERLQQLQEERDAEEERKEAINKRKESAKAELEQLKSARELQKKMGRALVQHAKGIENNGQREDVCSMPQLNTSPVAKKSVSFADAPPVKADGNNEQTSAHQVDWGDVTPGRLRAQARVALVSAAEAEKYPMKMRVVERHLTATAPSPPHSGVDSDDESPSTGYLSPHVESHSSDEDLSSPSNNSSDDEPLEEEFDYNAAQHHREIALEYHEKRHAIGVEAAKAMAAHALDRYDEHEPLSGQLPLSHFRADRMAAMYDRSQSSVSTLIGATVIPASRQKSLRDSVRLGKLENDQLVGEDSGESGSEGEAIREAIHMLQTGNIQNAGPDFEPFPTSNATPQNSDTAGSPTKRTSTATYGTTPSRFKLARGGIVDGGTLANDDNRDNAQFQPAISSVVERKAPGSSPSQRFPINKHPLRSPITACKLTPPMIIDSPSFPMTASISTVVVPPSSPTRHTSGPCETQVGRPCVDQSQVSPRDSSTMQRPVSKFMSERNKVVT